MNLTHLKYFCDAIRLGGLSAAAKANFVSQSAISQGISKLEQSLRVSLLAHHPNRLRLTSQGEAVFAEAQDLLKKIAQFQHNLTQEESLSPLEFACTHSFALAVIAPYLKRFHEEHPRVRVNFRLGQNENIIQMVKEGTVDFGILPLEICQEDHCRPYSEEYARLEKRTIYSGSFACYVSSSIKKSAHKNLEFILTPSDTKETILFSEIYSKKFGRTPPSILEVKSWEVQADLVAEGMGIGYLPDYVAKKRADRLQIVNFGLERLDYRITAISPKGMTLRKSSETFLSYFI